MPKGIIAATIATVILGAGLVAWTWQRTHYPVRNAPAAGERMIAFGDSLVSGVGVSAGTDWVSLVSQKIRRPIANAGVASDTTATALARLDEVLRQQPDVVIVMLGANDWLQRVPPDATVANLRAIITRLQEGGAVVLLLGVRGGKFGDPYHRRFANLARETQAAYVPNILDSILGVPILTGDDWHPNSRGHNVMAERLWPVIEWLIADEPRAG